MQNKLHCIQMNLFLLPKHLNHYWDVKSLRNDCSLPTYSIRESRFEEPILFYWISSQYRKYHQEFAEFYKNALLYLAHTFVESLSERFKLDLFFVLSISTLLGANIYIFGKLLAYPIVNIFSWNQSGVPWIMSWRLGLMRFSEDCSYGSRTWHHGQHPHWTLRPQPQTSEHLAAMEIMRLQNIIILQNKVDLIQESAAINQHEAIRKFIKGGSILRGVLKVNQFVVVRPCIVIKDESGNLKCTLIYSRIVTLYAEQNELQFAVPGGLIGVGTTMDLHANSC